MTAIDRLNTFLHSPRLTNIQLNQFACSIDLFFLSSSCSFEMLLLETWIELNWTQKRFGSEKRFHEKEIYANDLKPLAWWCDMEFDESYIVRWAEIVRTHDAKLKIMFEQLVKTT